MIGAAGFGHVTPPGGVATGGLPFGEPCNPL
jgi:hypothetical protein